MRFLVVAVSAVLAVPLGAQTVTNVRALQLADKTVEVLYDLSGAATGGATVTIAFSSDGGGMYAITPTTGTLSGSVGTGVPSGTNRRIVWNVAAQLAAGTYGTNYRAAVSATNPGTGGEEITVTLPGNVPLVMKRIPAGTFQMGALASERGTWSGEQPQHQVTLTSDYYMGKYEVTQGQWIAVMGWLPHSSSCGTRFVGDSLPTMCVSWDEVNGFLQSLNAHLAGTGQPGAGKFRLPTEAEWERAARGGTQTRFFFGDVLECDDDCGPCPASEDYCWICTQDSSIHPVGTKSANQFGLFDVCGNVEEWTQDWFGAYSSPPQTNPSGPPSGTDRVNKGGRYRGGRSEARSARRSSMPPSAYWPDTGFRLARSL